MSFVLRVMLCACLWCVRVRGARIQGKAHLHDAECLNGVVAFDLDKTVLLQDERNGYRGEMEHWGKHGTGVKLHSLLEQGFCVFGQSGNSCNKVASRFLTYMSNNDMNGKEKLTQQKRERLFFGCNAGAVTGHMAECSDRETPEACVASGRPIYEDARLLRKMDVDNEEVEHGLRGIATAYFKAEPWTLERVKACMGKATPNSVDEMTQMRMAKAQYVGITLTKLLSEKLLEQHCDVATAKDYPAREASYASISDVPADDIMEWCQRQATQGQKVCDYRGILLNELQKVASLAGKVFVKQGGRSSLDMSGAGVDKGSQMIAFLAEVDVDASNALFAGDEMFLGGNDAPVAQKVRDIVAFALNPAGKVEGQLQELRQKQVDNVWRPNDVEQRYKDIPGPYMMAVILADIAESKMSVQKWRADRLDKLATPAAA